MGGGATIRAIITNHYFADCQGEKAYVTCCAGVDASNMQCIRRYSDSDCTTEMFPFQPIPQTMSDVCEPMPAAMPNHPTKGADHRYRNTLRNQVYCSKDENDMCTNCNLQGDHNDGANQGGMNNGENPTPGSHNFDECVNLNGAGPVQSYMKVACPGGRRKL